jgi:hypothetical protein
MLMSCSLCEPESRADGALAAQELNQLNNAVAEAPANAVATARFPEFVQQAALNTTEYLARATSAPAFQILEILTATAPPSGSGSYRCGRGRGMRRNCSGQSCIAYFED